MAVVALRSLRVTADFDAANYARGMAAKVAADKAGAASSKEVGAALAQTDAAMDKATGRAAALSRSLIDGYGSAAQFESVIRRIGRAVDQGMGLDRAATLIEAANKKFGLTANAAALARQGYASIALVVAEVNSRYLEQAGAADKAAAALRRLGEARDASASMIGGMSAIGGPRVANLAASEHMIAGMSSAMDRFSRSAGNASNMTKQLSFQLFDIGQGLPLLFQSPLYGLQNLAVQTGQVTQLYAGQGGLKQAFTDTKNIAVGLGTSLIAGLATPMGQVAIIAGVVATAVGAIFLNERSKAQAAEGALKRHVELIGRIKDAYNDAKGAVGAYGAESIAVLLSIEQEQQRIIKERLNQDALSPTGGVYQYGSTISSLGVPPQVVAAAWELRKEAAEGAADWRKYGEALVAALNDPLATSGQKAIIRGLLDEAAANIKVAASVAKTRQEVIDLQNAQDPRREAIRGNEAQRGDLSRFQTQQKITADQLTAAYEAQLLSIRAISHEEEIAAAMAQERANALEDGNETAAETLAIQRAGNLVAAQFEANRKRFQNDTAFADSQMGRTGTERDVAEAMRQLWGEDFPKYMNSAEAAMVRFNDELAKSVARMDEIRSTTSDTISTLLGGLESGKLGDSVTSAMESIKSKLNDALAGTITKGLMGEAGQFGGGPVSNFLAKIIPGLGGTGALGSSAANPMYVTFTGGVTGGGVGDIISGIFGDRTAGGGGGGRKAILDLIAKAEGTGSDYNTTLGYGLLTGGKKNLTGMTLDQIDALQGSMLSNPANKWNSSALGRYQITRTTLRGLRKQLGLGGDELYDESMQDMLAGKLLNNRAGQGIGGLRNEWAGLQKVDTSTIQSALDQSAAKIATTAEDFSGSFDSSLSTLGQSLQTTSGGFMDWIKSFLGIGLSAGASSLTGAGLFHNGGIVGSGGAMRYVHPAYFDDAPRLHGGNIGPGEYPAILRRGEPVFPSMAAAASAFSGQQANDISVHVHNNNGSKIGVKESTDGRGRRRVDVTLDEQISQTITAPRTARSMRQAYGIPSRVERT